MLPNLGSRIRLLALSAFCLLAFSTPAFAGANCWCRINLGATNWGSPAWDLGSVASYAGMTAQLKKGNQDDCRERCSAAVLDWFNQNRDAVCKQYGGPGEALVIGQAALGTRAPEVVQTLKTRCCEKPAVVKCPPGSVLDVGRVPVRCKRELGGCPVKPSPPNGTNIGADNDPWGFWWNGAVVQLVAPLFYQPREIVAC
ncbi:MAG TPA: hypothetical protein VF668_21115 [Pyrinomonadaceae bacterium]